MTLLDQAIGPDIGVHKNIPAEEYHRWPLPSNSILSKLNRSPAHAREAMDNSKPPTPAMDLGTALHCLVLEPHKFLETYSLAGQCAATKKGDGQRCTNDGVMKCDGISYCGVHSKGMIADTAKSLLTLETWDKIHGMAATISSHPAASKLLRRPGNTEVSVVFRDVITGVLAKMRADRVATLADDRRIIIDVKTTENASEDEFPKSIYNFGYFRQASMYLRGMAAVGEPCDAFVIIAVEKDPPHGVAVYRIIDDALDAGSEDVTRLLRLYARCEQSNHWPAYADRIVDISLPPFAFRQLEFKQRSSEEV